MTDNKKIVEHAKKETSEHKCPICGSQEWQVGDEVYALAAQGGGSDSPPVACVKCGNCGFVALFAEA